MFRRSTALLSGMAAFALVAASAATLGGLDAGGLGAESAEVTACTEGGIAASFTTGDYDLTEDLFPVETIELTVVDGSTGCAGTQVTVALLEVDEVSGTPLAVLAEVTGVFDDFASGGVAVPAGVSAEAVTGIAVSIVG